MILLLLLALALLLWMIQRELDSSTREVPMPEDQCANCHVPIDIDWMVCPHCQQRLRESCPCCHKGKMISHPHCPFCGKVGKERMA